MRNILFGILTSVLFSVQVNAAQTAQVYEWAVAPGKAGAFVEAVEKLQNSKIGGDRTAQVQLQSSSFNGVSPATHRVVVLYPSLAESEKWNAKFNGSKEQAAFTSSINAISKPVRQYIARPLVSWGEVDNDDKVFDIVSITATDPAAIAGALGAMMTSEDTKDFPGQLWLVQIERGQASPAGRVTHEIVVGYESLAELESWSDKMYQTEAWATWLGVASKNMTVANRYILNFLDTFNHGYSLEDFD